MHVHGSGPNGEVVVQLSGSYLKEQKLNSAGNVLVTAGSNVSFETTIKGKSIGIAVRTASSNKWYVDLEYTSQGGITAERENKIIDKSTTAVPYGGKFIAAPITNNLRPKFYNSDTVDITISFIVINEWL
jgi:predicted ABC-type ATPase